MKSRKDVQFAVVNDAAVNIGGKRPEN